MPTPNLPKHQKYTFKQFDKEFPDDRACMEWLVEHFYPYGIHCLKCGEVRPHHLLKSRPKVASCDYCGNHTHPTAGTIFHKSSTSLKTWFHAVFLMSATRCGISAMQLMRETGVTYKTAWRMFKQIRSMLSENVNDLEGEVEADETWIGGRRRGNKYKSGLDKTMVAGMVERKSGQGRVHAYVVEGRPREITDVIAERVMPESVIFTDEAKYYTRLPRMGYEHHRIYHAARIYVRGNVHTNTIEGYWSLVKRGISGVYHSVSKKHLQKYLNEYSFRYNHRRDTRPMFRVFCAQLRRDVLAIRPAV
jgi:transposase